MSHEWDAETYARVSTPQQKWGKDLVQALHLGGREEVIDLGCGAGLVTRELLSHVPPERLSALDASEAMLKKAREVLPAPVRLIRADLGDWKPEPDRYDVMFSSATVHWVADHAQLWRRLIDGLRPGGVLHVQYGGAGNIPNVEEAMSTVATREPFQEFLGKSASPWVFDSPATAAIDLEAAGFKQVHVWSERRWAAPADLGAFLASSVVRSDVDRLPPHLRGPYVDLILDEMGRPRGLQYVRLNCRARRT